MLATKPGAPKKLLIIEGADPKARRKEKYITEIVMMNLFVAVIGKGGQKELATPPLDGTILEGLVRDCILTLARERLASEGWEISERKISMRELVEGSAEGRLLEVFGANTATVINSVREIRYQGQIINCKLSNHKKVGPVAKKTKEYIESIQYGDEPEHRWR